MKREGKCERQEKRGETGGHQEQREKQKDMCETLHVNCTPPYPLSLVYRCAGTNDNTTRFDTILSSCASLPFQNPKNKKKTKR